MSRHYLGTHDCVGHVLKELYHGWEKVKHNPDTMMDILHRDGDLTQQLAAELPKMLKVRRGEVMDLSTRFNELPDGFWQNTAILSLTKRCTFLGDASALVSLDGTGINPMRRLAFARLGCTPQHRTVRDILHNWSLGNRWHLGSYLNLLVFNYFVRRNWIEHPRMRIAALSNIFETSFVVWQDVDEFEMELDICAPENTVYLVASNNVSDS